MINYHYIRSPIECEVHPGHNVIFICIEDHKCSIPKGIMCDDCFDLYSAKGGFQAHHFVSIKKYNKLSEESQTEEEMHRKFQPERNQSIAKNRYIFHTFRTELIKKLNNLQTKLQVKFAAIENFTVDPHKFDKLEQMEEQDELLKEANKKLWVKMLLKRSQACISQYFLQEEVSQNEKKMYEGIKKLKKFIDGFIASCEKMKEEEEIARKLLEEVPEENIESILEVSDEEEVEIEMEREEVEREEEEREGEGEMEREGEIQGEEGEQREKEYRVREEEEEQEQSAKSPKNSIKIISVPNDEFEKQRKISHRCQRHMSRKNKLITKANNQKPASKFTVPQIIEILQEVKKNGKIVTFQKYGISAATHKQWHRRYRGFVASQNNPSEKQ